MEVEIDEWLHILFFHSKINEKWNDFFSKQYCLQVVWKMIICKTKSLFNQ
jgi:hypothetical protein